MSKSITYIICLAAVMLALASCVKNDPDVAKPSNVSVNVVNASEEVLNFYLNGTRQNSITGIFPLGANGYTAIPRGNQLLAFRKQFNRTQFTDADILFTLPVKLDSVASNVRYSIFAGGITSNDAFMVLDTLDSDSKNAKLRFVVASPQFAALRVYLNDTLRFTSSAFKQASTFKLVGNGQKVIKIRSTTSDEVLYTSTIPMQQGLIYTLFSAQLVANNKANLRAGLVINQ